MALAIFTYRPIFNTFLKDTAVDKIEMPLTYLPDIKTIVKATDTLVTQSSQLKSPAGIQFIYSVTDTIRASSVGTSAHINGKPSYINKHLPADLYWKFVGLVFILILYVTMVYGPIAAFLVEMFPTKIRYTSMSLPYHIGNGVFGGLVPFIGLLLTTTYTKDPLVGLWYPIGVTALCLVIGTLYLTNKIDRNIRD
jgi:hypothetical protein